MEESPISSGSNAPFSAAAAGGRRERVGEVDCFELSSSSVLKLLKGDITSWFVDGKTDAIVNAGNEKMLGGGGVDGAIHHAAGPELKAACYEVPEVRPGIRCPTGEARITPAFRLPVSKVIHTVGPMYGAFDKPEVLLRNAYINSLKLAKENNIHYIAFSAISCGVYGSYRYPYDEASKIAISAVKEFPRDFKEVSEMGWLSLEQCVDWWKSEANTNPIGCIIPYVIIWFIWRAHNSKNHEDALIKEERVAANAIAYIILDYGKVEAAFISGARFLQEKFKEVVRRKKEKDISQIICRKPCKSWIKVNIDGSWNNGKVGAGGIFRDHTGKCICFFSSPCVANCASEYEVWAILLAVKVVVML